MRQRKLNSSNSSRTRRELRCWRRLDITLWENAFGLTLTCKKVYHGLERRVWATPYRCEQTLLYFLQRLNRRVYSMIKRVYPMLGQTYSTPRGELHFKAIWVLEQDANGRFHYHLALDLPLIVSVAQLDAWVRDLWPKTDFGYKEVDIKPDIDQGWIHYMTKEITDGSSNIDLNFELPQTLNNSS